MRIIAPDAFLTQPWQNGGGVTHEVARAAPGAPFWRLSIAEVAADGPFSAFPGMTRILTVIEGAGMVLETPGGRLAAQPMQPVRFAGDLPVTGRLLAGPVRDLNLIFDARGWQGAVASLAAAGPPVAEGGVTMLLDLAGRILPAGAVAMLAEGEAVPEGLAHGAGLRADLRRIG